MENKMNACISIISSRTKCLPLCLESLWNSWNNRYNYPVYVHYFDDIYDSEETRKEITSKTKQTVIFNRVEYKTPPIPEDELYYNRRDLWYVNTGRFTINRKGYLHMCHFTSNMGISEDSIELKYDYVLTNDDESGYPVSYDENPFEILKSNNKYIGALFVGQRLKNGAPHQGHLDTRVGLWDFFKNYVTENNISPKSTKLQKLLLDPNGENNYHYLEWCDSYVINTEMFNLPEWKNWIAAVNNSCGIYKYRWGDNEIITLFAYMIQEEIFNLGLVESGIHNQGMFRSLQDYAPSVKNINI
jgi:hypothetical protein